MSLLCDILLYICHMNETSTKILLAAITLWSKDTNTSLDDIAKHVGISRRTLHRHYQGRKDLVKKVMEHLIDTYLKSIDKIMSQSDNKIESKLKKLFFNDIKSANMYLVYRNLRTFELPDFNSENDDVQTLHHVYHSVFIELKKSGLVADINTVEWLEAFYSSVIESAINMLEATHGDEEYKFIAWKSFWNGIKK